MTYVELNPVRATIAKTPQKSDYTSIKQRCEKTKAITQPNHKNHQVEGSHPFVPFRMDIRIVPLAIACLRPDWLNSDNGIEFLQQQRLTDKLANATHISWLTGGSLIPAEEYQRYIDLALAYQAS